MTRRIRLLAALLLLAGACRGPAPGVLPISGPVREASGRILFASLGQFKVFIPSTKRLSVLPGPEGWFAGDPLVSPDGTLIAFATTVRTPEGVYGTGTDLYLMAPDGTARRPLLEHDASGISLTQPAWAADGASLYFTRVGPGAIVRIERVGVDGSGRTVIILDAHSPTASSDANLAFLSTNPRTFAQTLWVLEPGGGRPPSGRRAAIPGPLLAPLLPGWPDDRLCRRGRRHAHPPAHGRSSHPPAVLVECGARGGPHDPLGPLDRERGRLGPHAAHLSR